MAKASQGRKTRGGGKGRPLSTTWLRWENERLSIAKLLKDLDRASGYGDDKWVESMKKHYAGRLKRHKEAEPVKFNEV